VKTVDNHKVPKKVVTLMVNLQADSTVNCIILHANS